MSTHANLIKRCAKAVLAGSFANAHNSLHIWAGQVRDSLQTSALAPDATGPTTQLLKETFGHFLVKALLAAPCFDSLSVMAPLLKDLACCGVSMPKVWDVVHTLAAADLTHPYLRSESVCKTSNNRLLGMETRIRVFGSQLYADFLAKRTEALFNAAKAQKDVNQRRTLI